MARLLLYLILASAVLRMATGKWPWQYLSGPPGRDEEGAARTLLGLGRSANREDIIEAHRNLLIRVHPDRGGSNEAVHRANAARDLLLARLSRSNQEKS